MGEIVGEKFLRNIGRFVLSQARLKRKEMRKNDFILMFLISASLSFFIFNISSLKNTVWRVLVVYGWANH